MGLGFVGVVVTAVLKDFLIFHANTRKFHRGLVVVLLAGLDGDLRLRVTDVATWEIGLGGVCRGFQVQGQGLRVVCSGFFQA